MKFISEFIDFYLDQKEYQVNPIEFNIKSCIVFPNQRGCLFFLKYFAEKVNTDGKTYLFPTVLAWDDFVFHITGRVSVSTTTAIMMLYELSLKENITYFKDKTLDETWFVLKKVYGDFRRVDLAMLDEHKFFLTALEHWKLFFWKLGEEMKEGEKNFLEFFEKLNNIHTKFKKVLLENNLAYLELALRDFIENQRYPVFPYRNIFLVNVISHGKIFHAALEYFRSCQAEVKLFVDHDPYYISEELPEHEAGKAYKVILNSPEKNFFHKTTSSFQEKAITIQVYGIPLGYNQVSFLVNKLQDIFHHNKDKLFRTAVILSDIHLLLPLLKALPSEIACITNFSMGFPLRFTMVFSFIKELIKLKKLVLEKRTISREQLESVLLHPIVLEMLGEQKNTIQSFLKDRPFISKYPYNEIKSIIQKFASRTLIQDIILIFGDEESPATCEDEYGWLTNILSILHGLFGEENELERMAIEEVVQVIETIKNKLKEFNIDKVSIWSIVLQELKDIHVTLKGDPLKGLQVLGPMETAVLDFDHVFILGFNEGSWPINMVEESYIPYEIREKYDMNISLFLKWEYAYLFYRLLQHAKTVEILYNNIVDERYGKEPSHFIKQLEYELIPWLKKHGSEYSYEHSSLASTSIYIEKLNDHDKIPINNEKPLQLSFSELYDYVVCPYKFALKYVEKIQPQEEVSLEYAPNELGNYAHKILEKIIDESKNFQTWEKIWTNFQDKLADVIAIIDESFLKKEENLSRYEHSFNVLMRQKVKEAVENFLRNMKDQGGNFLMLEAEKRLKATIDIENVVIELKGIVDLVEEKDDVWIIRDFKLISQLKENFNLGKINENKFLTEFVNHRYRSQLLYYAMLLHMDLQQRKAFAKGNTYPIKCELVVLLANRKGGMFKKIKFLKDRGVGSNQLDGYDEAFYAQFHNLFTEKILKKYVSENLWDATPSPGKCYYCEYQNICYAFKGA
ncbi:MAG: PD-(D/E)XK nuclease family protein [Bacteroidales bacterium]|nr:PD-(D/E)XK nuclease family protein [Bacteroidales bacterium]